MPDKTESQSLPSRKKQLVIIFFSYAVFASVFGCAYRYALNPDGISLLRLSGYIAKGHFMRSVVSGWSPLMIWGVSPFLLLGFDGLTAARIAIGLSGAGLLLCSWFLASRFDLSEKNRFIAVLIAALLISFWTIQFIAADVLIAALTLFYIYLVTDPRILNSKRRALISGTAGGFSYLAHHYAFPFFVIHYPLLLLLKGYFDRDKEGVPWKKITASWAVGIAGFSMIASIWVGVVSVKYGKLTISSKGSIAHAIMGPKDRDRRHPFFVGGLFKPRDNYAIHVFEDPSDVKFATWSPFESRAYFIHQLRVIKENAVYIVDHFVNKSPFFNKAFVLGALALIPIALLSNRLNSRKKFLYAWVVMTFSVYSSGFLLLIARSPRRFYPLMIIFLFSLFHFMEELKTGLTRVLSDRKNKLLTAYVLILLIGAFSIKPGMQFLNAMKNSIAGDQVNPYQEIAEQIDTVDFPAPCAIIRSSQKPHTDYYIAYFLNKQVLGRPRSSDIDGITKELRAANAKSLLVFDNMDTVTKLKRDKRYIHAASRKLDNSDRYSHAVNIEQDNITGWDEEVNIFTLK